MKVSHNDGARANSRSGTNPNAVDDGSADENLLSDVAASGRL